MKLLSLILAASLTFGLDMTRYTSASSVAVNNSTMTQVRCPLEGATMIQVMIKPSSTAQILTIQNADTSTFEVASGASFNLRVSQGMAYNQVIFSAQTATSSAVLQVVAFKEAK
jgi:hypothetical protein